MTEPDLLAAIGQNITARREAKEYSQRDLARLASISPGMISRIERGQIGASAASLQAIAAVLDCSVADLHVIPCDRPAPEMVTAPLLVIDGTGVRLDLQAAPIPLPAALVMEDARPAAYLMPDHSMSPTLNKDDVLIVDTAVNTLQDGAVMFVTNGSLYLVRRVQLGLRGQARLVADSADKRRYPDIPLDEADFGSLVIVGRVTSGIISL